MPTRGKDVRTEKPDRREGVLCNPATPVCSSRRVTVGRPIVFYFNEEIKGGFYLSIAAQMILQM